MAAGFHKLATLLEGAGPAPCEYFDCEWRARCAAQELCCDAFRVYVMNGRALHPKTVLTIADGGSRVKILGQSDAVQPTHAKYLGQFPRRVPVRLEAGA